MDKTLPEGPDPQLLESLDLLLNWDLLEHEADWEILQALDNTPVVVKARPPKVEKK